MIPLNAFQQVMRLWDAVHPYNALHAIALTQPQAIATLDSAWRDTLRALELGRVEIHGTRYTHAAAGDHDLAAKLVESSAGSLDELLTQQIEQPFRPEDHAPFRAFVWTDGGRQIIGVTYHHWAADSFSIRRLMRQWFARLFDPAAIETRSARVARSGLWHHYGPDAAGWRVDEAFGKLLRDVTRFARARRCAGPMGACGQRVTTHQLPSGVISEVAIRAKQLGVTVNDVLSSVLLQTMDELGVHRLSNGLDELAIGTVADLRGGSVNRLDDFGLFLGFTTTIARPAELEDFARLLRRVAAQNAHHKQTRAPQTSVLRMGFGLLEARLTSPRRWAEAYRRRMPLAASISNVTLNRDWPAQYHPAPIADYFRVTPTGPMIPLLFTPTTLGENMNFCLTANTDHIDEQRQSTIAAQLIKGLTSFSRRNVEAGSLQ